MSSHILEVNPDSQLEFSLSHSEANPRCVMTLKHPGTSKDHIAFKVKTTQPRRYLVRPNQGLVAPGNSASISILLVEKDKQALLQSFERLGQPGLDHSKDKFLVQSCTAPESFASKKSSGESSELYDALTSMWSSVTSGGSSTPIFNKKLHVRHVVQEGATSKTAGATSTSKSMPSKLEGSSDMSVEKMSHEQLVSEFSRLRSKYDELLTFSVSLTAERDILSNTLEQTKRDYNREISSRPSEGKTSTSSSASKGSLQSTMMQLLVVAIACFIAGMRMGNSGGAVGEEA
eukprot:CAMPEP_0113649860 /NCGR_PEP_ID=MMETSP0017_2-20120614/26513_1 /TAXON_ID=2856 /ORGANISM="Cylindrotheca closterium" /LENGTH=288 /DNA_ID=CAMNT_0000562299 /DNA_START=23 /DNA_END=889 /DNA_ORIENTATION=- /assembly_acc=CAM_ASM_000147